MTPTAFSSTRRTDDMTGSARYNIAESTETSRH